jgi:tetratricopeptide (TPR) repeat protein
MSNRIFVFLLLAAAICYQRPCFAQLVNYNAIQVKVLYEALEFDKAIESGQILLKSRQKFTREELATVHQYMALSFYNTGKIDSARSHFLSLLSIQPDFEPDPINVSPKIISFFEQLKNETVTRPTDHAIGYTKYVFLQDLRPGATFRSAVLPGWGQLYKHQKTRGHIIGGVFIASLMATGVSLYLEKDNHNKYLDSTTPASIEANYDTYNSWFKKRKVFTITTISVWAFSILDALWAPYSHSALSIRNNEISLSMHIPLRK